MPPKPTKFENIYDFWIFIVERMAEHWKQTGSPPASDPAFHDYFKRELIDLVRSETPLDPIDVRQWLADALKDLYFPLRPDKERKRTRQYRDAAYQFEIERYMKAKNVSKAKAMEDLFPRLGLKSPEALDKRLKRAKQERERDKKL
jgi:hypothetical protein